MGMSKPLQTVEDELKIQYTKYVPPQPPKTIYQFMLNCGSTLNPLKQHDHGYSSSSHAHVHSQQSAGPRQDTRRETTSLTRQITKFICFLIQNIYCQTAHKSQATVTCKWPQKRAAANPSVPLKLTEKWEEDIKIYQMYLLRHQNATTARN